MLNLVGQPDKFQPVYNPINFYVNSDNKTQEGFKYLADVFSAGTSTRFARYRPAPRPVDGYGVIDINQVLSSRVSFFIDQYQNIIADTPESYVNYDIEFGEEYVNYWRFYDNFDGGSQTGFNGGGLISATQAHTFEVGDQIYIQQDPGYVNEGYNGVHTVLNVPNPYSVILDIPFSGSPANGGTAVYADRRKTTFTGPQEYLYNSILDDNLFLFNGWTEFGPDGCSVRLFINTNNSLTFVIPDASCGSINKSSINMFSAFTPGQEYRVQYTVSNVNNPSNEAQYVRAKLGGTAGQTKVGTGYTDEYIVCGTGTTFEMEFYMDANTAGFGSHSESVSGISVTSNILVSGYSAWNGGIQHQSLINYTDDTYTMSAATPGRFLTDVPNNYRVRPENKMWINFHVEDSFDVRGATINTRYGEYVLLNLVTGNTPSVYVLPVGPENVSQVEGTTGSTGFYNWSNDIGTWPVFKNVCWDYDEVLQGTTSASTIFENQSFEPHPWYNNFNDEAVDFYIGNTLYQAYIIDTPDIYSIELAIPFSAFTGNLGGGCAIQRTDYYSIHLFDTTGGTSSETINFNVDRTTSRYSNVEIYFIDRLGSLIPKNFELQNAQSIKVERSEYQTLAGGLMDGKWNFKSTDRGRHVNNTTVVKQVELNAAFITEAESNYLQELISSPEVYIMEYGQLWPVVVKTNNYDVLTKLNKKNIPFKMTVEYANNDSVQNF